MMHSLAVVEVAAIEAAGASMGVACVVPTSGAGACMPGDTLMFPVQSPEPRQRAQRLPVGSIGAQLIAVPIEVRPTVRQRSEPLR